MKGQRCPRVWIGGKVEVKVKSRNAKGRNLDFAKMLESFSLGGLASDLYSGNGTDLCESDEFREGTFKDAQLMTLEIDKLDQNSRNLYTRLAHTATECKQW